MDSPKDLSKHIPLESAKTTELGNVYCSFFFFLKKELLLPLRIYMTRNTLPANECILHSFCVSKILYSGFILFYFLLFRINSVFSY